MKKSIIILFSIILTIVLISVVYCHLPFQIKYRSEIKFGNQLIEKIENFRKQNDSIPQTTDYVILQSFGFKLDEGFLPFYQKINSTDYILTYCWGFDPPWLYYYSKTQKWDYGFDFPFLEKNIVKISFPDWLRGVWHNSEQSNTDNFIFWIFSNDTITYQKGYSANKKEVLNEKYADYKKNTYCSDSEFQISFTKEKDTIIYNFKLQKLDWTTNRALSYSLIINGIKEYEHITTMGYVLINQKDFIIQKQNK